MSEKEKQLVTIKGTKEGLIFYLDDDCSFRDLYQELETKMDSASKYTEDTNQVASVILKVGFRFIQPEQNEKLNQLIEKNKYFTIERYDSNVIDKKEAEAWFDQSEVKSITQIVRSGQVLEVTGDLLLIGDVNPGGEVKASGNIFVLGN